MDMTEPTREDGKVCYPKCSKLQDKLVMKFSAVVVIGQKAFMEAYSSAMQKNGRPYNNRYVY
jgi:hypothetical protein